MRRILMLLLAVTALLVIPTPPANAAPTPVATPVPTGSEPAQPGAAQSTTIAPPNYHWNASSGAAVGECTDATNCWSWARLPAGKRTDSYLGWTYAYGVRYDALACFDFWSTPADNSQLGWTFSGRVTVTRNTPLVWLDRGYHWRYAIHTTIACP